MKRLCVPLSLLALALALALCVAAQTSSRGPAVDETKAIGEVIKVLYDCLTVEEGQPLDFAKYEALFIPEARFVRANKDGTISRFTRDGFLASLRDRIANGQITTLREREIAHKTQIFGRMAQVFSSYTKLMNTGDPKAAVKGVNAIQLVKDGGIWKICASLWMDEFGDFKIPAQYLAPGR